MNVEREISVSDSFSFNCCLHSFNRIRSSGHHFQFSTVTGINSYGIKEMKEKASDEKPKTKKKIYEQRKENNTMGVSVFFSFH